MDFPRCYRDVFFNVHITLHLHQSITILFLARDIRIQKKEKEQRKKD